MSEALISRLLAELLGNREIIAYPPAIARAIGCAEATLFLAQGLHWQSKIGQDAWFYKLRDAERTASGVMLPPSGPDKQSWEWEVGLSRAKQESARKKLKALGLLEEKLSGVPAKLYYRIPLERVTNFLLSQLDGNSPTGWGAPNQQVGEAVPGKLGHYTPSLTKTTSEITSKTTTTHKRASRGSSVFSISANLEIETCIQDHRPIIDVVLRRIESPTSQQDIVDEFAGVTEAARQGKKPEIVSPRRWLEAIVQRYLSGEFTIDLGMGIQKRRANRNKSQDPALPIASSPTERKVAQQKMQELRAFMSTRPAYNHSNKG
ncbi:hypothetical protein [Herbaspirillum frisingense]|uniref:hypothetical protein n=1 Tax=Herbaspirillum frisingense TaxID=92645 RepID=UPI0039B0A5C3